MEQVEKEKRIVREFDEFYGVDLSNEDLSNVAIDTLLKCDFDTKTTWPEVDKLPAGFNPEKVLEDSKNPGLGIRDLHKQGIDGRGITVAIIDQTLSSNRNVFDPYIEYTANVINYKECGLTEDEYRSMHGPAVASLLVGKECGVAPGAKLVYRAVPSTPDTSSERDFNPYADALLDIIELNKTFSEKEKIRIVSCSIGYMEDRPEPGLDRWIETIKIAEDAGIIISDVGERTGVDYIGGGSSSNKENVDDYALALFLQGQEDFRLDKMVKEGDVDGIVKILKETKKDKVAAFSDAELRARVEKEIPEILNSKESQIIIPSDYRTMSSRTGVEDYMYNGKGGMSWAVPYLSGIFALVLQIKPELRKEQIAEIINKTAEVNKKGLKVINPKGIIKMVKNTHNEKL